MEHQGACEQKRQPEQAGAEAARFGGCGVESEAEKHEHNEHENERAHEQFARAEFGAQFLREQYADMGRSRDPQAS